MVSNQGPYRFICSKTTCMGCKENVFSTNVQTVTPTSTTTLQGCGKVRESQYYIVTSTTSESYVNTEEEKLKEKFDKEENKKKSMHLERNIFNKGKIRR